VQRYFVGITGASGHRYAEALIRGLAAAGHGVDLCVTVSGAKVLRHELGIDAEHLGDALGAWLGPATARAVRVHAPDAIEAPPSSGTALTRAVILCPCSMGTLARVAAGFSSNLVERAADVALKEGRTLVLVPRETPLSVIHLENMLRLARLGAIVLPAAPGFYHHPRDVDELVQHVVGKILDRLGLERPGAVRWQGELEPPAEPGPSGPRGESRERRPAPVVLAGEVRALRLRPAVRADQRLAGGAGHAGAARAGAGGRVCGGRAHGRDGLQPLARPPHRRAEPADPGT
jgi:4-hydroxy-3-polyprenylbenzoate decarboxylase